MKKTSLIFTLIFIISAAWWSQPHFKYRLCLPDGIKNDGYFIERLSPLIIKQVIRDAEKYGVSLENNEVLDTAKLALDHLSKCFRAQGQRYCRYAGTNETGDVRLWARITGYPDPVEQNENRYRFVVPKSQIESGFGVTIATMLGDFFGPTAIEIENYDLGWKWRGNVCKPGCGCKSYVEGRGFDTT